MWIDLCFQKRKFRFCFICFRLQLYYLVRYSCLLIWVAIDSATIIIKEKRS